MAERGGRVPVTITQATQDTRLWSGRRDDSAPWNAGGYIYNPDASDGRTWHCTSGFAMNYNGASYVITSAHCGTPPDRFYNYNGSLMGSSYKEDWDKDMMLINARGYPWMFDGTATTTTHKVVHSWGYRATGELLCQSGSSSGTVCGLKTQSGDVTNQGCDSDGDCYYMHGLTRAIQVDGRTGGQGGDSGGPVFSLDGSGVRAKGVVHGGSGTSLLFQDLADPKNLWNAVPVIDVTTGLAEPGALVAGSVGPREG